MPDDHLKYDPSPRARGFWSSGRVAKAAACYAVGGNTSEGSNPFCSSLLSGTPERVPPDP